jgi:hypothetical protein
MLVGSLLPLLLSCPLWILNWFSRGHCHFVIEHEHLVRNDAELVDGPDVVELQIQL